MTGLLLLDVLDVLDPVRLVDLVDLVGRVVVAVAFGWAAIAKLADLPGLRATLYLSRLTRPWVPQLSVVLPAVELALAALLVTGRTAWPAAVAASLLLLAFTAFLATDARAGEGCNCFGRHSRSATRRGGVLRDLALLAALVPALARGPGAARWGMTGPLEMPFLVLSAVLAMLAVAWGFRRDRTARRGGRTPGRRRSGMPPVPGPPVRRELPPFDVPALDGSRLRRAALGGIVFVEPGCGQCAAVLPLTSGMPDVAVIVVAGEPAAADVAARYALDPARVGVDPDGGVADLCEVPAIPAAGRFTPDGVLHDGTGRPAPRLAVGAEAVRALLSSRPAPDPVPPPSPPP